MESLHAFTLLDAAYIFTEGCGEAGAYLQQSMGGVHTGQVAVLSITGQYKENMQTPRKTPSQESNPGSSC
ncbi:hypothetical protein CHARACLAT_000829, partial [Characodon lateralis]|nr:hypothetical protein [Characodon lateralis]